MKVFRNYAAVFFLLMLVIPYAVTLIFSSDTQVPDTSDEYSKVLVYRTGTGVVEEVSCYDYLCNTLSGEMQANYEIEALKAQAVACYTYMLSRMNYVKENENADIGHNGAYVCDDSSHCMAYLEKESAREKWGDAFFDKYYVNISSAVKDVMGLCVTYNGELINAVFHSISSGNTQSALEVWGTDVPYLVSCNSDFDSTTDGFKTKVSFSQKRFADIFLEELGVALPENTDLWIGENVKTESGMTKSLTVADTVYAGAFIRKLFSLRSSCFDVEFSDGEVVFTVYGYGHGVGMSQSGANALAKKGYDYKQILEHYYSGVEITTQKF